MSECGGCKGVRYADKVSVYLKSASSADNQTIRETLKRELGFTERQTNTVVKFTASRGECLIFEGDRADAIDLMEKLVPLGIRCQAIHHGETI